jgi:uncharacterized protein (TIGR02678 family)
MREFEILLNRFWVTKEADKELYYAVKDSCESFRGFVEEKLGYKLIVTPAMIKLEKTPGKPEAWMGIQEFDDTRDYAFLCLALTFLEDKGDGDQFVLSQITEFIQSAFTGDDNVDWTLFRHRKSMVKVLRLAAREGLIRVDDGDEVGFIDRQDAEVLYESTGLSRYFVRNFTGNISNYETSEALENDEWLDVDRDRGSVRRNRVYRRIFMSPAVYSDGADDQDYLYIKNFKGMLQHDVEIMLDGELQVYKNGAFVVLSSDRNNKEVFPDSKAVSDIVLQLNGVIIQWLQGEKIVRRDDDVIVVSDAVFENILTECRRRFSSGWSKEYREMGDQRLLDEVLCYMKGFGMAQADENHREVNIMPLCGLITGGYPESYIPE